ncbi:MAG: stage II sporulation protein R [Lutisporaceae bacterium]
MKPWMIKASVFLLIMFFMFGIINYVYINTDRELADVADKLIRLHVVANSDSVEDQELKRKVRDEVIKQISPKFEGLKDISEVREVIASNLALIESIAKEVVQQDNKIYGAKAVMGSFDFPTKIYGNLTLPAGSYQALKVVLGKGEGQNWWCVMFPPLCFIDIAHGVVPEKTMSELKQSLTEEEYKLLTATKTNEDMPIKLKFKIVEIAKSVNHKMAKVGQLFVTQ